MDFSLSDEQRLLQESVQKYVQNDYDFSVRTEIKNSKIGFSERHWQTFAELGWLSIPFAEEFGGFDGGIIEITTVMEELGKGLVLEPYLATVLLAGELIANGGNERMQEKWLDRIIGGEAQGAFAYHERQSRFELSDVLCAAAKDGDGYILNGTKAMVLNGGVADVIIVAARTAGDQYDRQGITLFCLDAEAAGVTRNCYRLMDGQQVANIELSNIKVGTESILGDVDHGYELLFSVVQQAMISISAEAVGIMEKLYKDTVEYAQTRKQFNTSIGSFQALQHRMVDMFIAHEQAKSMVLRAACAYNERPSEAAAEIYAMKALVAKCGTAIGEEAIQIHGGMGITDELAIGHYVKRLMVINNLFGNADFNQQRFCEVSYTTSVA